MKYCKPAGCLDEFHQRTLDELQNVTAHPELAIAAGMDYCAEEAICAPPWLVKAAATLLRDLLMREKARKRGRAAGHIARYRQDLWDVERWDAVEGIRNIRNKVEHDVKLRRAYGETRANSRAMYHHERMLAWLRHGTFECASMYLSGRDAHASADAVRASYRRCKRRSGTGHAPDRYYLFDESFLLKLGFPSLTDRKPGTKRLPLYNLTP